MADSMGSVRFSKLQSTGYSRGTNKTGVLKKTVTQREINDTVSIKSTGIEETGMVKPAVKTTETKQLSAILQDENYISTLDVTTSMVPGSITAALTPQPSEQSFSDMVNEAPGDFRYRQTSPKTNDPLGDAHIIRDLDKVPGELIKSFVGFNTGKDKPAGGVKPDIQVGKQSPIKMDALMNKFKKIIQENPQVAPKIGEEHQWSPQAKKFLKFGFIKRLFGFMRRKNDFPVPLFGRSKLFLCLACGWTTRYMKTGNEKQLKSKLMKYKDKSVKLDDVLRESYLLNKGDLYGTLMTAENVLGNEIYKKDRANVPLQKKLEYIRNDSSPEGDNYGAWYHFMGAALYGLMRPGWMSSAVVKIESLGSLFLEGKDPQEDHINNLGSEFGTRLKKMINEESWKTPVALNADTNYMNLTEFRK